MIEVLEAWYQIMDAVLPDVRVRADVVLALGMLAAQWVYEGSKE